MGQARGAYPQEGEEVRRAHHPPPPWPRCPEVTDAAQPEEGAVRRRPPAEEGRRDERVGRPQGDQDVVAPIHHHPRHGRAHACGARRPQARARVRHRGDGRSQAGRVRAHPHVPVPRRARTIESSLMPDTKTPETVARLRHHRTSPTKVREVLRLIVGKDVADAREILRFCERGPADTVMKLLDSAVANAEHNDNVPEEELFVTRAFAHEGPTMKRWRPRARGRGTRIRKRTSHITIVVARYEDVELDRRRQREAADTQAQRASLRRRVAASQRKAEREAVREAEHEAEHDHDHDHDEDVVDELDAELEAEALQDDAPVAVDTDVVDEVDTDEVESDDVDEVETDEEHPATPDEEAEK